MSQHYGGIVAINNYPPYHWGYGRWYGWSGGMIMMEQPYPTLSRYKPIKSYAVSTIF